jgi:ribonuclease R
MKETIEEQAKHCSAMEIRASDAERASIKFKQVEYMSDFVGSSFGGVISGVTEWGIYVEMDENKCEGMARISELVGDYYIHDEDTFSIRGMNTGKVYRLGDKVTVKVKDANLMQRTIDLIILNEDEIDYENNKVEKNDSAISSFTNIEARPIFNENSPHSKPQIPASSKRNISKNTKPKTNSKPNGRRKK